MTIMVVSSDWHLDANTIGFDRYADLDLAVSEIEDRCLSVSASAFAFLGDLCDPDTTRCHRAVARAVRCAKRLSDHGIQSIWITGNHDVVEDSTGSHTLAALQEVGGSASVFDRPQAGYFPPIGAWLVLFPFVSSSLRYDPEEQALLMYEQYKKEGKGRPVVVLSHLSHGSLLDQGSESSEMARGRSDNLPIGMLTTQYDCVTILQGHYHKRQSRKLENGGELHVPGSLERLRFDEERHSPGWLELEL